MTIEDQIKFCQDRRTEWEPTTTSAGSVGMMSRNNIAMYIAIEASLIQAQKLMTSVESQWKIVHGEPEVIASTMAKSPEQRIQQKAKKG